MHLKIIVQTNDVHYKIVKLLPIINSSTGKKLLNLFFYNLIYNVFLEFLATTN